MASSLILKSESGGILGYLLINSGELTFMGRGNGQKGTLVLLKEDDTSEETEVCCDAQEHDLKFSGRKINGAYVTLDGKLYAASDKMSLQTGRKFCENEKKVKIESEYGKEPEIRNDEVQTVLAEAGVQQKERALSARQMRWPPPPCWPSARYVRGEWEEIEDG